MIPECVRIDVADEPNIAAHIEDGWRWIETLITYEGEVEGQHCPEVSVATEDDRSWMKDMAAKQFKYSRLHADPEISSSIADQAKRHWVHQAYDDSTKRIWRYGRFGFLIVILEPELMKIDLICTHLQRSGIATMLIKHGLHSLGVSKVRAGTQEINKPGRALYESLGMTEVRRQRTLHRP